MGAQGGMAGKSTLAQSTSDLSIEELRRPGKGVLVTGVHHPCDGMQGPACALAPPERDDTRLEIVGRIGSAIAAWGDAVVELRVARMFEHRDPAPILRVLLDAIAIVTTGGATAYFKALAASQTIVASTAAALTETVKYGIKSASAGALDLATKPAPEKGVSGYLSQLGEAGTIALTALRRSVLSYATDAELLAWHAAFAPSLHTPTIYRTEIRALIRRYEESGITEIGTRRVADERRGALEYRARTVDRVTRCAWMVYPNGQRELTLVSEDFDRNTGDEIADSTSTRPVPPDLAPAAFAEHARIHATPPRDIRVAAGIPRVQLGDVP